jgi:3-hydroxy-3-methylglutaryl CoA synthase
MTDVGIVSYGAYVPMRRLQRAAILAANGWFNSGLKPLARGERSIAGWDEDVVTMAVEACRDALVRTDRSSITALTLASTTAPFADRQNSVIAKEALSLPDSVATSDLGGSLRAGVAALAQAFGETALSGRPALCVASEIRKAAPASEAEMNTGDAAAAFVVGRENLIARLIGRFSLSVDFVDHFRAAGRDLDYPWEQRWVREEGQVKLVPEAIRGAISAAGLSAQDVDALIVPLSARGVGASIAKAAGIAPDRLCDTLGDRLGETGAAHPLVMLAHALESVEPGRRILVTGFGSGCEALLFETTEAIRNRSSGMGVSGWLARRREEANYIRYLSHAGHLALDAGMRAEFDQKQALPALYRERKTVLGLVGSRNAKTGAVQFPRTEIAVDGEHGNHGEGEDYALSEHPARVVTFTSDNLTFTPDPPAFYGLVDFEGGGRMMAEFCDVDEIEVGAPMRMMFRVKSRDELRGFTKYFWKAAPALAPQPGRV